LDALEKQFTNLERKIICESPPVANKVPTPVTYGVASPLLVPFDKKGDNRGNQPMDPPIIKTDDYYWMRDDDRKNPEILDYLAKENAYSAAMTHRLQDFSKSLYDELLSHYKQTDDTVPYRYGDFNYYTRTVAGLSYGIRCRKPIGVDIEEVILDVNELAAVPGRKHCDVTSIEMSPSHEKLAYAIDTKGNETYDIIINDLKTGKLVDTVESVDGMVEWGGDDAHIYYTKQDAAHRPYQLWRHKVGGPQAADEMLFEETDELYWMSFGKTLDGKYGMLSLSSKETSETHYIDLSASKPETTVIQPRTQGLKVGRLPVQ
jgi:oligopeptidase B